MQRCFNFVHVADVKFYVDVRLMREIGRMTRKEKREIFISKVF